MTIHQPIVIDPASIVAIGEARAKRVGRPKRGEGPEEGKGKVRGYSLTEQAHAAVARTASTLGVSESAVMEALARSLSTCF